MLLVGKKQNIKATPLMNCGNKNSGKNKRGSFERTLNHPVYNLLKWPNPEKAGEIFSDKNNLQALIYFN